MSDSTFKFKVGVPRVVEIEGTRYEREDFYAWAWQAFEAAGIAGVHQGTVLSADASDQGLETESWTLDAAEAPRERDWVSHQKIESAEFYFTSREGAQAALGRLKKASELILGSVEEQKAQDWDAQWKASFQGAAIPPFWRVLPPWMSKEDAKLQPGEKILRINPGAGFGTGTHETTQLCLQAIAENGQSLSGERVLDFGSGSGILAIGAALLGAVVDAVEIDPLAVDNARENASLNSVVEKIHYSMSLADIPDAAAGGVYPMVIANILRPVLVEFAPQLVAKMRPGAVLILSGLIESDTPEVSKVYSQLLGCEPKKRALGDWRSLVWVKIS